MRSNDIIKEIRSEFEDKEYMGGFVANDNIEVIEILNGFAVGVRDVQDQETWIFDDGSYITRNDDVYWTGDDIDKFDC